jgi:hypothetical protein
MQRRPEQIDGHAGLERDFGDNGILAKLISLRAAALLWTGFRWIGASSRAG